MRCEHVPQGRICFFCYKNYTGFVQTPRLMSTFEQLGLGTHTTCVPLLYCGKRCLQMITEPSYSPEINPEMGSRQSARCSVRYLMWTVSDCIWVVAYSLLTTAGMFCMTAVMLHCTSLLCYSLLNASLNPWGTKVLGAPLVNVNGICKASKVRAPLFFICWIYFLGWIASCW